MNKHINRFLEIFKFADVCYSSKPNTDGWTNRNHIRGWFIIALVLILAVNFYLILKGGN